VTSLSSRDLLSATRRQVEQLGLGDVLAHNVTLEEVWEPNAGLVLEVGARWDGEDLVDFLERELLGLADEAEDHAPGDEVETGVETDCTGLVDYR
jgi:hypothetical protein